LETDKSETITMAEERTYTIPLRKEFLKAPPHKRAKKAVKAVREFIQRHMKVEEVKLGMHLNELLWARGIKNPPTRIKIKTKKEEEYALVELVEFPFQVKKVPQETKVGLKEKILGKKKDEKAEEKKEQQKELNKELAKEEVAEQKKEHEGHHKVPGEPSPQQSKQEGAKSKQSKIVPQSGKKDGHDGKK